MYTRVCNRCGKKSYSSSSRSEWECPYCGESIENQQEERLIQKIK